MTDLTEARKKKERNADLRAHPDIDLILAMGWREYLLSKYYYAGDHIGWLEYPQKRRVCSHDSKGKAQSKDDDAEFMLIVHARIYREHRTAHTEMIERLFHMVLDREPSLQERMIAAREATE